MQARSPNPREECIGKYLTRHFATAIISQCLAVEFQPIRARSTAGADAGWPSSAVTY